MNDGGPAFPVIKPDLAFTESHGMSLRDWFAGQIASGYIACHSGPDCSFPNEQQVARYAFKVADAMLAERSKCQ